MVTNLNNFWAFPTASHPNNEPPEEHDTKKKMTPCFCHHQISLRATLEVVSRFSLPDVTVDREHGTHSQHTFRPPRDNAQDAIPMPMVILDDRRANPPAAPASRAAELISGAVHPAKHAPGREFNGQDNGDMLLLPPPFLLELDRTDAVLLAVGGGVGV